MVIIPIVIAAFVLIALSAVIYERKLWNNGICAQYNEPWVHFDNDSQGGRGYSCRDKTIWISYPLVDRIRPAVNRNRV